MARHQVEAAEPAGDLPSVVKRPEPPTAADLLRKVEQATADVRAGKPGAKEARNSARAAYAKLTGKVP